jgi:hypothetical protein
MRLSAPSRGWRIALWSIWGFFALFAVWATVAAASGSCHPTGGSYSEPLQWSAWPPGPYCAGLQEDGGATSTHASWLWVVVCSALFVGLVALVLLAMRRPEPRDAVTIP